jgi:hypothetical protein
MLYQQQASKQEGTQHEEEAHSEAAHGGERCRKICRRTIGMAYLRKSVSQENEEEGAGANDVQLPSIEPIPRVDRNPTCVDSSACGWSDGGSL